MSSGSNASTHHMLGGATPSHPHARLTVLGMGGSYTTYPFTPPIPDTHHRYPPTPETHHRYPPTPETHHRYPPTPETHHRYPPTPETHHRYPQFAPPTPETYHRYPGHYTEGLNYRMNFNEGSKYATTLSGKSKYGSGNCTEASRYDPNFSLAKSSSPGQTKKQQQREGRRGESRYMVRPKIRPEGAKLDPRFLLHPPTPELPRTMVYGTGDRKGTGAERKCKEDGAGRKGKGDGAGLYDWHIPRATLWCVHKGSMYDASKPCKHCQWKWEGGGEGSGGSSQEAETTSTCSSINPPPTFTALDNYRPVQPRPRCHQCSCGIIFAITTLFSILVLLLIMGFIIYIEMVLKHQTATVTDRM